MLFAWAISRNITIVALADMFVLVGALLPAGHKLPTHDVSRRMVLDLAGIEVIKYEICQCGKTCFRDKPELFDPDGIHQFDKLDHCPDESCKNPRMKDGRKTTTTYSHIGLTPQLKALFWDKDWREATHLHGLDGDGSVMHSIHDSPAWNEFLRQHPQFADVPTNLLLAFSSDGINPFGLKTPYTIWPQIFKVSLPTLVFTYPSSEWIHAWTGVKSTTRAGKQD
jgi:hypothetical protein